jgi:hypothetical protein
VRGEIGLRIVNLYNVVKNKQSAIDMGITVYYGQSASQNNDINSENVIDGYLAIVPVCALSNCQDGWSSITLHVWPIGKMNEWFTKNRANSYKMLRKSPSI